MKVVLSLQWSLCLFLVFILKSSFGQGNLDVDHYTGRARLNVPIASVSDKNLTQNIYLFYNADGVRVDDVPGWVGTNWGLSVGGEVNRVLHGLPDDYTTSDATDLRRGWLFNSNASTIGNYTYPADGAGTASCNPATFYNFINGFNNVVDSEPDEFRFSAAGLSGSFVFDNTGSISSIKVIPYQEILINPIRDTPTSPIKSFEITTPSGVKYTFSEQEITVRKAYKTALDDMLFWKKDYLLYSKSIRFVSSWKLSSIESAFGEKINFVYQSRDIVSENQKMIGVSNITPANNPSPKIQYAVTDTLKAKILNQVSSATQQVIFQLDMPITDNRLNPTVIGRLLSKVIVNEITPTSTTWIKTISFSYLKCKSTITEFGSDPDYSRIFLKSISVTDPCESLPPYMFEYNGIQPAGFGYTISMPNPGSPQQDLWGYYYATGSTHAYPKLYVYPTLTGIHRVSLFPKSGVTAVEIPGANRLPSNTSQIGALNKVTYPTGAFELLAYESHQFKNPILNNATTTGGGLRIQKITTRDGVTQTEQTRSFIYTKDGSTSGEVVALPTFWLISGFYKNPADNQVWTFGGATNNLSTLSSLHQWNRVLVRSETNLNADWNTVDSPIGYKEVTEIRGTGEGKTVFSFEIPYTFGGSADANWNPTYTHLVPGSTCPNLGLNQAGFYSAPFVPQTPVNFRRGLLLEQAIYEEANNVDPVKKVTYTYVDKNIGTTVVKGLNYEFIPFSQTEHYVLAGVYKLQTNQVKLLSNVVERTRSTTSPFSYLQTTTQYTHGTNHTFVTSSTVSNSDGSQVINRTKYAKDYGSPQAVSGDLQVNMIDALNTAGRSATVVEQTSSIVRSGIEKTVGASLTLFENTGTTTSPRIVPQATLGIYAGDGISSFPMSSFVGTGASRTFSKYSGYKTFGTSKFSSVGDLIRREGTQRTFQSFHIDILKGSVVASVVNAEANELLYTNFDNNTNYDFDAFGFVATDFEASGIHGSKGLGGFTNAATRYLKKSFQKASGTLYRFSLWYKPSLVAGTHAFKLAIKNTAGTVLKQQTYTLTVTTAGTWYFLEGTIDLNGIANGELVAELNFTGSAGITATVDDIFFAPHQALVERSTVSSSLGLLSVTGADGRMMQFERDKSGRLLLVRDHEGYILEKKEIYRWNTNDYYSNLTIGAPNTEIYPGTPTTFTLYSACEALTRIEWKVAPESDPTGGVFAPGTELFNYNFPTSGNYWITARTFHPVKGEIQSKRKVSVVPEPLQVAICMEGANRVNLCSETATNLHECTGAASSTGDRFSTTFTATPSGCNGGTYTYQWSRRRMGEERWLLPVNSSTSATVTIDNTESYEIKCSVTSSCGLIGETVVKSVYVYESTNNCSGQMN